MTGYIVQRREQNGSSQPASPLLLRRSPAVSSGQPTHAPRLDASLMKRHIYYKPLNYWIRINFTQKPKCLKQARGTLLSMSRVYILLIPPYFCFSKHGTLCCCPLETLPPRDYSNSARQSEPRGEKKLTRKVGKEQIKTRKIPQPPVESGTGARGVHLNRLTHESERVCRVWNQDWISL